MSITFRAVWCIFLLIPLSCEALRPSEELDFSRRSEFLRKYAFDTSKMNLRPILQEPGVLLSDGLKTTTVIDEQCRSDLDYWVAALKSYMYSANVVCKLNDTQCAIDKYTVLQRDEFAFKQVDSFGKPPSDVMAPKVVWMGSWDECLKVESPEDPEYRAQFCYVDVGSTLILDAISGAGVGDGASTDVCSSPLFLKWSVCMPKSCSNEDVKTYLAIIQEKSKGMFSACAAKCIAEDGPPKTPAFYVVSTYCSIGAFLLLFAGLVDYTTDNGQWEDLRGRTWMKCLLAFSLYTNGGQILNQTRKPGQIQCLDCIRTFSMTWVIAGHVLANFVSADNPLELLGATKYFLNGAFTNGYFSVDSFFFIGGVLIAYIFFKQMDASPEKIRSPVFWFLYYFHRYLRLSPPYFLFIGVTAALQEYLTIGPMGLDFIFTTETCKTTWWRNVLYINNLYDLENGCMGHTWYLAVDWQIHIFSPLLLIPLFKSKIAGIVTAILLLVGSTVANYVTFYHFDFPASYTGLFGNIMDKSKVEEYSQFAYFCPWIRYTPYVIGILTGYFLHKTRGKKLQIHWAVCVALWLASFAIGIGCVYSLFDYLKGPEHAISIAARASYYNWSRIGWALALAWVVIACQNNWAGPIKNFMELGLWQPLGRLTFCAYLTHYVVADVVLSMKRQPLHYLGTFETYVNYAIPAFAMSYAFSFLWSCTFELSFMKLEKMAVESVLNAGRSLRPVKVQPSETYANNAKPSFQPPFSEWKDSEPYQNGGPNWQLWSKSTTGSKDTYSDTQRTQDDDFDTRL